MDRELKRRPKREPIYRRIRVVSGILSVNSDSNRRRYWYSGLPRDYEIHHQSHTVRLVSIGQLFKPGIVAVDSHSTQRKVICDEGMWILG